MRRKTLVKSLSYFILITSCYEMNSSNTDSHLEEIIDSESFEETMDESEEDYTLLNDEDPDYETDQEIESEFYQGEEQGIEEIEEQNSLSDFDAEEEE